MLILDADPGTDDMLAMLLLLSQQDQVVELFSIQFGNCSLDAALQNTLSLFHVIQLENKYRREANQPPATKHRPIVACGMARAISGTITDAVHVHGLDGLAGIHGARPEWTCPIEWVDYYKPGAPKPPNEDDLPFRVDTRPSWQVILDILEREPENTVTIVATGPLSNIAKAAETNPKAFSRVSKVLTMGGAIAHPGNITPFAEFNVYADPVAAARVYALTSKDPKQVLPPDSPASLQVPLDRPLDLILFPLDLTERHTASKETIDKILGKACQTDPKAILLEWVHEWLKLVLLGYTKTYGKPVNSMVLHDPLTAAYAVWPDLNWQLFEMDTRVETGGQWTLGSTVVDRRPLLPKSSCVHDSTWTNERGNKVKIVTDSPFCETFGEVLISKIAEFGSISESVS